MRTEHKSYFAKVWIMQDNSDYISPILFLKLYFQILVSNLYFQWIMHLFILVCFVGYIVFLMFFGHFLACRVFMKKMGWFLSGHFEAGKLIADWCLGLDNSHEALFFILMNYLLQHKQSNREVFLKLLLDHYFVDLRRAH